MSASAVGLWPAKREEQRCRWAAAARGAAGLLIAALASGLSSSCATVDAVTGRSTYNFYSLDEDIQLGRKTIQANIQQARQAGIRINADPSRMAELQEMVRRIADVSDLPHLPYEVTLFHTGIVNAAAAPGGQLMVFEGLYDPEKGLVQDEDELAAVIAHEIAHVNCRHSTEELSKVATAGLLAELGAALAERKGHDDLATFFRAAFIVGSVFYIPLHSQQNEFEADRVGLFYMAKAGYDPRAAPRIWKRVAERQKKEHEKASIFATHPSSWDRYRALEKLVPYAMEEYAAARGGYPPDYTPPPEWAQGAPPLDWRNPDASSK